MVRAFATFMVTSDQVPVVFPLVHATAPEIDLGRWQSFARPLVHERSADSSGIIGMRNEAGYVCGLLIFHVENDLRHGAVLAIDLFVALDLVNDAEATLALLQAAEAKTRELGCVALHVRADLAQKTLVERLAAAGHRREASLFCRAIASATAAN